MNKGKAKKNCSGVRLGPLYPIKIWNCYSRILNDEETTNNSLEAWHQQFEFDVGKHPTINKLIEQFRLEQQNTELLIVQLNSGDIYNKRKKNRDSAAVLKKIVSKYNKDNLLDYIDTIATLL